MLKRIEIHCTEPNGTKMVINRLSSENTEASGSQARKAQLIHKARKMAYDWTLVFPNDKFDVVEV